MCPGARQGYESQSDLRSEPASEVGHWAVKGWSGCSSLLMCSASEHHSQGRAGQRGAELHGRWQRAAVCRPREDSDGVGAVTGPGDSAWPLCPPGRTSIHDPHLPLSSPTCGPPEQHRQPTWLKWRPWTLRCWRCFSHAAVPRFQGSRSDSEEERVLHCFSGLRVNLNFGKFSFQKYSRRPADAAVTRLLPSLCHSQRPVVTRRGPSHLRSTCIRCCQCPIHSPRPRRPAITRSGQVTRRCPPSIAEACVARRGLQSFTLNGPPHLPQPESLAWLISDWLSDSQPPHWLGDSALLLRQSRSLHYCSDLEHPDRHIWSNLITIFCILVNKFISEFTFWVFSYEFMY